MSLPADANEHFRLTTCCQNCPKCVRSTQLRAAGFGFTYGLVIWNVMANAPGSSRLNDGQRGSAAGLMVSSIFLGLAVGASVGLGMSDAMGIHS